MSSDTYTDWFNARENARQANASIRTDGLALAKAEANYYLQKSLDYARLLFESNATAAENMVKGQPNTNRALYELRKAQSDFKATCNDSQLFINEEAHCYKEHSRAMSGDSERY